MGKRYHCDYCDRSFKDDTEARKKHLTSLQHVKNRADHYSLFKDPETILREEALKTPCKRFMTFGECAFGHGCKFSHYAPPIIRQLRIAAEKNHGGRYGVSADSRYRPNPSEIIDRFFGETVSNDDANDGSTRSVELANRHDLPPSLWPIRPETVGDSDFGKWGSTVSMTKRRRV